MKYTGTGGLDLMECFDQVKISALMIGSLGAS